MLREVDYTPGAGCLPKSEFDAEFQPFLSDLADSLQEQIATLQSNVSPELMGFWRRVVDRCR